MSKANTTLDTFTNIQSKVDKSILKLPGLRSLVP
jgi:hypothetical protein